MATVWEKRSTFVRIGLAVKLPGLRLFRPSFAIPGDRPELDP
ncbi:hypothetical protein FOQG_18264 [Fusarium oxysporum f. sp. raphani 54005]|uniref:Uncharacterized protein n=1 Tax=Fusarium oxysporum f. sp. raphani 54005 TaxID=1089458 RepID=X0B4E6_FUSOX|nr:hypothetical protein FOQG_18264 [Fusarium oxysporum f. sp. raphani 54005]